MVEAQDVCNKATTSFCVRKRNVITTFVVYVILLQKVMQSIRRRNTPAVMPYSIADYIRLTAITYQSFGLDKKNKFLLKLVFFWRRHPESNRGWRLCRPMPYRLAIAPYGAIDEIRTRDIHLGKVALYQLSYYRI